MISRLTILTTGLALSVACHSTPPGGPGSHLNLAADRLALEGYDPVSYFEPGGSPSEGNAQITVDFDGALYRFRNEANRQSFLEDPQRFEPRFGGWCAWAMIESDKVEVDPESFLIEDDSLLLFYDGWIADTRKRWTEAGSQEIRPIADRNWLKLTGKAARSSEEHELGLAGFDPVSLEREADPVRGLDSLETRFGGLRYRFGTERSRIEFLKQPSRFLPRYDGYAALELASGDLVRGVPSVFLRERGALFFFTDEASRDVWAADSTRRVAADREWMTRDNQRKVQQ